MRSGSTFLPPLAAAFAAVLAMTAPAAAQTKWNLPAAYPANNYFPGAFSNLGFVNLTGGDYRLATSSTYRNKGYDGRDIGADINTVNSMTSKAVVGP